MTKHIYKMKGTCATKLSFELFDDNTVHDIHFIDGCDGNLKALSVLLEGTDAGYIVEKLKGLRCERKSTSCADQLATAVSGALAGL